MSSLDALRGLAIVAMILVNAQGDTVWPQLTHAAWNGITLADLVFPAFLVAAGAALAVGRPAGPGRLCRRVLSLVALGLIVNRVSFGGPWRYPGVLQRIALCYLLAAVTLRMPRRATAGIAVALGVAYALVLHLGGATMTHSFGATVDVAVFGRRHLYHQYGYDPEGLIGSVAATTSVLIGYLAVRWLASASRSTRSAAMLAAWAGVLVGAGWALDGVVPINKRLWSPSFTLVSAGIALVVLAGLYEMIEVGGYRLPGRVLEVIGANAIAVYVASELGDAGLHRIRFSTASCARGPCQTIDAHLWIYRHWFASWAGARPGSLMFSLAFTALLWGFAALLWRARLVVRV